MIIARKFGVVYLSDKLQKLENLAFRIITRESYENRSANILENAGVSNLQARREHHLALLMFKVKNKVLPNHLAEILTNTNSIHNHNTRNSEFNFALCLSQKQTILKRLLPTGG